MKSLNQSRHISFQSVKSLFRSTKPTAATDLQKPLTSLPNATGAGAFAEPITYQVLGAASNMLNIKLPRSSILNVRYSNKQHKIIGMNGHINLLYKELARLSGNNIVFQRCFNQTEPMSLLISSNAQNSNFAVVNNNNSKWIVKKPSLFAWSGPSIKPTTINKNSNSILVEGEGSFVISSPGQIAQIDLADGEAIHVNANSLVGFTNNNNKSIKESNLEFNNGVKSMVNLSLGKVPFSLKFPWIKKYIQLPNLKDNEIIKFIVNASHNITVTFKKVVKFFGSKSQPSKNGLFVEIKGPKTIFVTNAVHIDDPLLTKADLKKLLL